MARKYKKDRDGYIKTSVWDGTYTNGKKHYITLRTKDGVRALEKMVVEHNRRIEEGKYVNRTDSMFTEYAKTWLKVYKASRSLNTIAMYENIISVHFACLEGIRLQDIKRIHYHMVLSHAAGHKRTQQQIDITFKQVIRAAIANKDLPAAVYTDIFDGAEKITYKPNEKRPLRPHEIKAVFSAELSTEDRAFVYLLYGCGLRRGEALALTKSSVDLQTRYLTVRGSLAFDGNNPYLKETKSLNGARSVPIPAKIIPALEEHMQEIRTEYLFCNRDGSLVTKSGYNKRWERILHKLQDASEEPIEGLTAHIFRHNYCTTLCYQMPKLSIKKIAQLLGDTDKVVMEVYNHILLEKECAAEAIDEAF